MTFAWRGWARFGVDPAVADWVRHALPLAQAAVQDPALSHWRQCEGTWFVGVDALPNDSRGRVGGSQPLAGEAVDFISRHFGPMPELHRAQVSVVYPGYPRPRDGETDTAFRYRRNRDAAHVDGILAVGPDRVRKILEPHAFILGLPLTSASSDAAPLVVWEGSHAVMRAAFTQALKAADPRDYADIDVTEAYKIARRRVFETCRRVELPAQPGEAILLHRLALHGVAPWAETARAGPDGRMIVYFRPECPGGVVDWLNLP